jgi:hypothetical protein
VLYILILITWWTATACCVTLCRAAADGDHSRVASRGASSARGGAARGDVYPSVGAGAP